MAKIYLCENITSSTISEIDRLNVTKVLYYNSDVDFSNIKNVDFVSVRDYDRRAFEISFSVNKLKLEEIAKKNVAFFSFKGVSLVEAINKDLFWVNIIDAMFSYALSVENKNQYPIIDTRRNANWKKNWLKSIRIFSGSFKDRFISKREKYFLVGGKISNNNYQHCFCINGDLQLDYYKGVIEELGQENCFILKHPISGYKSGISSIEIPLHEVKFENKKKYKSSFGIKIKLLKKFSVNEVDFILQKRNELIRSIKSLENISEEFTDLSSFFMCAQESSGFGIVASKFYKKGKVVTVNSHNGIKHVDVYNKDNYFDIWCTWDSKMKEVLMQCGFPENGIIITGNLAEDEINKYQYSGSLNKYLRKDLKVISLFTTLFNGGSVREVGQVLIDYIMAHADVILFIRKHPRDKDSKFWESILKDVNERIEFIDPSVYSLYDQLSVSDLSIVFGSTVALESKWFEVPTITYEPGEESLLYCTDGLKVIHVNNLNDFQEKVADLLSHETKSTKTKSNRNVAKNIAEAVLAYNK